MATAAMPSTISTTAMTQPPSTALQYQIYMLQMRLWATHYQMQLMRNDPVICRGSLPRRCFHLDEHAATLLRAQMEAEIMARLKANTTVYFDCVDRDDVDINRDIEPATPVRTTTTTPALIIDVAAAAAATAISATTTPCGCATSPTPSPTPRDEVDCIDDFTDCTSMTSSIDGATTCKYCKTTELKSGWCPDCQGPLKTCVACARNYTSVKRRQFTRHGLVLCIKCDRSGLYCRECGADKEPSRLDKNKCAKCSTRSTTRRHARNGAKKWNTRWNTLVLRIFLIYFINLLW